MPNPRTNRIGSIALALALAGVPMLAGCDKTKAEKDVTVTHPDGSTETDASKTVQKPDGSIQTKTEKTTSNPSTP